jgi:hypothetical protein
MPTGSTSPAPLLGAAVAVGCAVILHGRGAPISHAAGSGVLTPGDLEQKARLSQQIDAGKVVPPGLEPTATEADTKPVAQTARRVS